MEIKEIEKKINKKIIEYKHQKIDHIKLSRFFQKLYKNGWYKLSITINKPEIGILIDKVAGFEFEKAANEHNRNPKEIDSPESIIDWYYDKFIIKKNKNNSLNNLNIKEIEEKINKLVKDYIKGDIGSREFADLMDEFNKNNIFDILENNNKKDLIMLIDMASDKLVYEILQYDYNPKKCIAQETIEKYYNNLNK